MRGPNAEDRRYLVYLEYWMLNFRPLMVYPKVLFPPNFSIKDSWPGLSWGVTQGRTDQLAKQRVRSALRSHKFPELTHELAAVRSQVALGMPAFVA